MLLSYKDFHDYQKREVARQFKNKAGYLFLDTGMGKTVMSFALFDQLKKRGLVNNCLIIGTKKIIQNVWRQEAQEWEFSKDFTFSIIHGSTYKGSSDYSKRMAFMDDVDFHMINYEGLKWLTNYMLDSKIFPWQMVVYDESTKMKRSTTQRFKAFKQFMRMFEYRYCLTGTPIPNGLEDIFGQAYCVDQGAALRAYITNFRKTYMYPAYQLHGRVTVWEEQPGSRKRVAKKIAPRVTRLKKTDHLKLPPLEVHEHRIEMSDDLRETYDEFEKEMFMEFGGHEVEAFSNVARDMKLRQMLQGAIYNGAGKVIRIHDEKLKVLKNITKDIEGNSLIAYNFRFERDMIWTVSGNSPFLDARTKDKEAEDWIIGWNNYEHKYFLVNPASAAHGLNLQAGGNNVIWYGLTWNAEHYSQLVDRLWRQGQRRPVHVHHIIFNDTMDEVISAALQRKDRDQQGLMNDITKYLKGRY